MRALLCLAAVLVSATAGYAAGPIDGTLPLTKLDRDPLPRVLSAINDQPKFELPRGRERSPLLGPSRPPPAAQNSGISIGPIHAEATARYSRSGKRRLSPHYTLEGVTVLGGSVGGSVDGRGGMVTLNWHTGP